MTYTKNQVDYFNSHQNNPMFHPYTCPNDGDNPHIKYEFGNRYPDKDYEEYLQDERNKGVNFPEMEFTQTKLQATEHGWYCPVCDYKQQFNKMEIIYGE